MVLDVVYNHFGPEGNYLALYAPQFFNAAHHTPWGAAINFDGAGSRTVRDFFIHNALYWLEEYHLDGLRLDAIHAVRDGSEPHIVTELAGAARAAAGPGRSIYLTLENFDNAARFLGVPGAADRCDAQWNDDVHHCLHVLLTGETQGYYGDYRDDPHALLCRALAEGFAYQGELSQHAGAARGERSAHLPPSAFINFLQNHDQVGNRARGERLAALVRDAAALRAASAVLLLAPAPPLLFMGEEWAAAEPFPWFCDFEPQLAAAVRAAREREFPGSPDPGAPATCLAAQLDWRAPARRAAGAHVASLPAAARDPPPRHRAAHHAARRRPAARTRPAARHWQSPGAHGDFVLHLLANLGAAPAPLPARAAGRVMFATHPGVRATLARGELAPWSVLWLLERREVP